MLYQNLFDLIPLVGSADRLISSDYHEDKHPKPYPIVGRHFLGKKSPHLWSLEACLPFSFLLSEIIFFSCCIIPNYISSWNSIPVALSICISINGYLNMGFKLLSEFFFGANILSPFVPQASMCSGPCFSVNTKLLIKKRTFYFL